MKESLLAKDKTIVLSSANSEVKTNLLGKLKLKEIGAEWPNKPTGLANVDGFWWESSADDSPENRQAYIKYLTTNIALPQTHGLIDAHSEKNLLTVDSLDDDDFLKIKGTTDVAIMENCNIQSESLRNNIEILFELKKPPNLDQDGGKDHTPQIVGEHLAASFLNGDHPVVSVLTDLNNNWTFYWFAKREGDDKVTLHKLWLKDEKAATEAKYILDRLYDADADETFLPTTLSNRLSFNDAIGEKDSKLAHEHFASNEDDPSNNNGSSSSTNKNSNDRRSKKSSSDSSGEGSSSWGSGDEGGVTDSNSFTNMANALSLFAPPSFRDVANELDLLDMVDENEKYEIVRSFAMQHIVPHIAGG